MFCVYVIINLAKIYIGQTADLESRLKRHNGLLKNKNKSYTHKNNKSGWRVVYKEDFNTRREAMERERELKSFRGREFIRNLINKKES